MKIHTKVSVVVESQGKILLLKEWSNKKEGYHWNLIKGTLEDKQNETLTECAIREAKEEVGLQIQIDRLLSCYVYAEELVGIQFNFLARPKKGGKIMLPKKEDQESRGENIIDTKWVTKRQVLKTSPTEFISKRIYKAIEDWVHNKSYAFEILTTAE